MENKIDLEVLLETKKEIDRDHLQHLTNLLYNVRNTENIHLKESVYDRYVRETGLDDSSISRNLDRYANAMENWMRENGYK
ncbi:MAG: hypothetical protein ACOCRX_09555 [Candidatus Woesearchaeota archaeon]